MTPEQIAKECEGLFQAGGPKVYTFDPELARFRPSMYSGKRTIELADPGHQVWQRRAYGHNTDRGRRYAFTLIGTGR